MTQAVLPGLRQQGSGVVVNVSSPVTLKPFPMLSAYTASKAAIEAFSENLALEVEPFGVRVRVVMPGRRRRRLSGDRRARSQNGIRGLCRLAKQVFSRAPQEPGEVTSENDRAEAIVATMTDGSSPFPA